VTTPTTDKSSGPGVEVHVHSPLGLGVRFTLILTLTQLWSSVRARLQFYTRPTSSYLGCSMRLLAWVKVEYGDNLHNS